MPSHYDSFIQIRCFKGYYLPFLIGAIIPLVYHELSNSVILITDNQSSLPTVDITEKLNEHKFEPSSLDQAHIEDVILEGSPDKQRRIDCAPWIFKKNSDQRKVLLVNFDMGDNLSDTRILKFSLTSMIGSHLREALEHNQFQVDEFNIFTSLTHSTSIQREWKALDLKMYHRIFYMINSEDDIDQGSLYNSFFLDFDILCKLRVVFSDNAVRLLEMEDNDSYLEKTVIKILDRKQIVFGYPDTRGTFLGSYLFDLNFMNMIRKGALSSPEQKSLPKEGLIKITQSSTQSMLQIKDIIKSLIANNFTIHVICDEESANECKRFRSDKDIILHNHHMTQREYIDVVSDCAFTLGGDNMTKSPLTWIDLALGAAILNSVQRNHSKLSLPWQIDSPYIYNIVMDQKENVVQAAKWASANRFNSFIAPELRAGTMNNRVCAMLEDESLCSCPNPTFEVNKVMKKEFQYKYGDDSKLIDCRSTFLMKKGPIFPSML